MSSKSDNLIRGNANSTANKLTKPKPQPEVKTVEVKDTTGPAVLKKRPAVDSAQQTSGKTTTEATALKSKETQEENKGTNSQHGNSIVKPSSTAEGKGNISSTPNSNLNKVIAPVINTNAITSKVKVKQAATEVSSANKPAEVGNEIQVTEYALQKFDPQSDSIRSLKTSSGNEKRAVIVSSSASYQVLSLTK